MNASSPRHRAYVPARPLADRVRDGVRRWPAYVRGWPTAPRLPLTRTLWTHGGIGVQCLAVGLTLGGARVVILGPGPRLPWAPAFLVGSVLVVLIVVHVRRPVRDDDG